MSISDFPEARWQPALWSADRRELARVDPGLVELEPRIGSAVEAELQYGASADGRVALAGASEALLETFDRLTAIYERSMAILTDPQFSGRAAAGVAKLVRLD